MGKIVKRTLAQARKMTSRYDWKKFDATNDASITRQIAADPDTAPPLHTLPVTIDLRAIRRRSGLTQPALAHLLRLSLATIRNWEQGRTRPDAPAIALLTVFDREPEAVKRALKANNQKTKH